MVIRVDLGKDLERIWKDKGARECSKQWSEEQSLKEVITIVSAHGAVLMRWQQVRYLGPKTKCWQSKDPSQVTKELSR